jgi:hypothetical protein
MMRFHSALKRGSLCLVLFVASVAPAAAQGPRIGWTSYHHILSADTPSLALCSADATRCPRLIRSSKGRAIGRGALIGLGVGLLGGVLVYSLCQDDDSSDNGSCIGKAGLNVGLGTAAGALIGLLVGGTDSPPSKAAYGP